MHLVQHLQSADSFTDEYRAFLESTNNTVLSPYGLTVVDAVYVAALAMNASVPRLRELGLELEGFRFEDYNKSAIYADILKEEAGKLDFQGLKVSEIAAHGTDVCVDVMPCHGRLCSDSTLP